MTTSAIDKETQDRFMTAMKYEREVAGKSGNAALLAALETIFGKTASITDYWWSTTKEGLYRPVAKKQEPL